MTATAASNRLGARPSAAEALAVVTVGWLATTLLLSYAADVIGLGLAPVGSALVAALGAIVAGGAARRTIVWRIADLAVVVGIAATVFAALLWLTWPGLLPPGSGPDLTHHLLLVDYLHRHGTLVHDPAAGAFLGEMADYTPGLHILTVVAARLWQVDPFRTIYAVVALAVALKLAVFALVLLRGLDGHPVRVPVALFGVWCAVHTASYSFGSFLQDSFLAQVVGELFAVVAWWALLWWDQAPARMPLLILSLAASATFLTWPVWLGPIMVACAIVVLTRGDHPPARRVQALLLAATPVAIVVVVHAVGRTSWVSILGTSGAVTQPSPAVLGMWLPALVAVGLVFAIRDRGSRVTLALVAALGLQALALWAIAAARGAATPYMAIKMIYLAMYPAIALAVAFLARLEMTVARLPRARMAGPWLASAAVWALVIGAALVSIRNGPLPRVRPVVSADLFAAGQWARQNLPPGCIDYLVGNEYTAYWLHLAVLGNPRASARTGDDATFDTQASIGRWLVPGSPRYAIADLDVLPQEIRDEVDVVEQDGRAAVIARRGASSCP
jgi:hypothetical protein